MLLRDLFGWCLSIGIMLSLISHYHTYKFTYCRAVVYDQFSLWLVS